MSGPSGRLFTRADPTPPTVRGLRQGGIGIGIGIMLVIAMAIAIAVFGLILPLNAASRTAVNWVEHTHEVIEAADQILISVDNIETGQRGFLLTHDSDYLSPYNESTKSIWHQYFAIRDLTADNPRQQSNMQNLAELLQNKMSELDRTIVLAGNNNYTDALSIVRAGDGRRLMDKIRQTTADISSEEQRLLQERHIQQRQLEQRLTWAFIALAILGVIGFLLGGVLLAWIFTARATKQRVAAESIERQRLLDMVNVAAVMMRDVDGTIRFWSEGCHRLYGYTAEHAIGRSSHELLQTVFPVSLADTDATLLRRGAWNGELRHRTQDGAQIIVSASKTLHDYADGSGRLVVETLTDVTALRQAEEELRKSEAMFRGIFDSQFQFIKLLTPDGIVVEANQTALEAGGLTRADVVGQPVWETGWWPATERNQLRNEIARARHGETIHREVEIIGAGGKTIWVDFSLAPKRDLVTGAVQWIIAEGRDLTDKRSLTAQLAQAQKVQALGQLAGGIAHDFNNILQAVLGAAALIGQSRSVDDRARHLANTAIAAANRGISITQRLLSFARRGELRAEPIDTAEMLSNMREVLAHTLGTVISVRVVIPPDLPALIADQAQLDTAIINLGTNARDAMPNGGTIILSASAEQVTEGTYHPAGLAPGAYVRLSIIDDGIGMDAATLARATEPFFTTKPQGQGTGLGVSMVKGFADQSGGGLSITSAPNAGTTVSIWLRRAVVEVPRPNNRESDAPTAVGTSARILLVDDDELVREILAASLEDAGFTTLVASSGSEAVALIEAGEVADAMVSDLSMPGMNGVTTIQKVRELRPELPCFLLTGYVGERAALSAENTFTLVRKPVNGRILAAQIEAVLESTRQ